MMPKHHVTRLELSKRLKQLGVEQLRRSYFYWIEENKRLRVEPQSAIFYLQSYTSNTVKPIAPAYLSSEIGEMLPPSIQTEQYMNGIYGCQFSSAGLDNFWEVFDRKIQLLNIQGASGTLEVNAKAETLINILDNFKELFGSEFMDHAEQWKNKADWADIWIELLNSIKEKNE